MLQLISETSKKIPIENSLKSFYCLCFILRSEEKIKNMNNNKNYIEEPYDRKAENDLYYYEKQKKSSNNNTNYKDERNNLKRRKQQTKLKKKQREEVEQVQAAARTDSLNFLTMWKENRQEWKFKKSKSNYLVKNAFNTIKVYYYYCHLFTDSILDS